MSVTPKSKGRRQYRCASFSDDPAIAASTKLVIPYRDRDDAPKTAVENWREIKREMGTKDHWRMRACIGPVGTGRSGLLSVSSETAVNEQVLVRSCTLRKMKPNPQELLRKVSDASDRCSDCARNHLQKRNQHNTPWEIEKLKWVRLEQGWFWCLILWRGIKVNKVLTCWRRIIVVSSTLRCCY